MAAGGELDPHVHVAVAAPGNEGLSLGNQFVQGLGGA